MLQLRYIRLYQFKNYPQQKFCFDEPVIGITGPNGAGKTNLLDAVYYLGFTRSYFNGRETTNATHSHDAFRLEGAFSKNGKIEKVSCVYRNGRKEVQVDEQAYDRFSHHIGRFPAVFIAPDDSVLITGGSELRRKFMDVLLAQMQSVYLDHLIAYQKIKTQRNSILKSWNENSQNNALLDVFDSQLITHGLPVFEVRRDFLASFNEKVQYYYNYVSGENESVQLVYESALHGTSFGKLLSGSRQRDKILQRTTRGIHRDDLVFLMNGHPLKQVGSQGQKKSFLFALKLAQFEILKNHKGFTPILLLDDIFEKLDQQRIKRLIDLISGEGFGQVFITDTEAGRLEKMFERAEVRLQMIKLSGAKESQSKET